MQTTVEMQVIGICDVYVALEGYICCWHIYGNNMVIKSCSFLTLCAALWDLHVDYSISAMVHKCAMWQAYLFRGICQ